MKVVVPFTFAAVAQYVAAHGWRPFPGLQTSKVPAMQGWSGLNSAEWDDADLTATIAEFQPADLYCCCFAVQAEIVVVAADITNPEHAVFADELADNILGNTPLVRIGCPPKQIRIYRTDGLIRSRKLHPLEIFCGSGQFVGFGWHEKAGGPYRWPCESPLTTVADSRDIPAITRAQIDRFSTELFKVVPRRLSPTRQSRSGAGAPQTISERLLMLTMLHGSWKRAAAIILGEACEGAYNDTLWTIVTSAAGRGIPERVVWELFEKYFHRDPAVSEAKVVADFACMIERTRPVHRPSSMTFSVPGGRNGG